MTALPDSRPLSRSQPRHGSVAERSQIVQIARLGTVPYEVADAWQRERSGQVADGTAPEIVALMQHEPVYTQGRRGGREHVLASLAAPIVDTDRGGDVTFHGPGQLVVWPILRLREREIGIARYVRMLEESAIRSAATIGVEASRVKGQPGVWVGGDKLASVGVRLQSGVSRHGMAINCDVDLSWFNSIRACGIADGGVTSLSAEAGRHISVGECTDVLTECFGEVFGLRCSPVRELSMVS